MTEEKAVAVFAANVVTLTGRVVGTWVFEGDQFIRLAVRRPREMPANPDGKNFDGVNVRINYFMARGMTLPERGAVIQVNGFVQQRDTEESLDRVLRRVPDDVAKSEAYKALVAQEAVLRQVKLRTSITEVMALAWEQVAEAKPQRERRGRRADEAPAADKPSPVPVTPAAEVAAETASLAPDTGKKRRGRQVENTSAAVPPEMPSPAEFTVSPPIVAGVEMLPALGGGA